MLPTNSFNLGTAYHLVSKPASMHEIELHAILQSSETVLLLQASPTTVVVRVVNSTPWEWVYVHTLPCAGRRGWGMEDGGRGRMNRDIKILSLLVSRKTLPAPSQVTGHNKSSQCPPLTQLPPHSMSGSWRATAIQDHNPDVSREIFSTGPRRQRKQQQILTALRS